MEANLDNIVISEKRIFLDVPLTVGEVVHSSADVLASLMDTNKLTAGQVAHCKLLRRREQNKLAARRVRRRHLDEVIELTERLRQAVAAEVALNVLKEEKLNEYRRMSRITDDMIGECLYQRQLDPRIYGIEVRDGRWQCIELWSQREVTEDELQEMHL